MAGGWVGRKNTVEHQKIIESDLGDRIDYVETNVKSFRLFCYVVLWFLGNAMLILFIISCWKLGSLSFVVVAFLYSFLQSAVLVGLYRLHEKHYQYVRKIFNNIKLWG